MIAWIQKLASLILALVTGQALESVNKWVWRVAAVTLAFSIFYSSMLVSWNIIVDLIGTGAGNMTQGATGHAASGLQLFKCMLPSTTAQALTLMMSTAIQATIVKLTRQIAFAKVV